MVYRIFSIIMLCRIEFFCTATTLLAQNEKGLPHIRNYSPKEYSASPQNWDAVQGRDGIMYFANSYGVLSYNGVNWKLIGMPNRGLVRSLAADSTGRIYVGGYGQFGYLQSDSIGVIRFVSLLTQVPQNYRSFADVWEIFIKQDGVYFVSAKFVFRWDNQRIKVWKPESQFTNWDFINDQIFVMDESLGMKTIINDSLTLVVNGQKFVHKPLFSMWPYRKSAWLIKEPGKGYLIDDGNTITPMTGDLHRLILQSLPHHSGLLPDGRFVITTLREGVFILDSSGAVVQLINKKTGLQSNDIKQFYSDKSGNLWLPTNNGISRVSIASPVSFFNEKHQLTATVDAILRANNTLYAATNYGVRRLRRRVNESDLPFFEEVPGNPELALHLLAAGKDLLAATGDGVFLIGDRATRITSRRSAFLHRSKIDSNLIYAGLKEGLDLLRYKNGKWSDAGVFPGITEQIRTIVEDDDGNLWLGTRSQGVLRVIIDIQKPLENVRVERFGEKHGLVPGGIRVQSVSNKIYFSSDEKLMRFDESIKKFVADSTFGIELTDGSHGVDQLYPDPAGNVWVVAVQIAPEKNILIFGERQQDGSYRIEKNMFEQFSDFPVWYIHPEDHVVWLGGPEGIIRYDMKNKKVYDTGFSTVISSVFIKNDSLIYAGNSSRVPEIQYDDNAMRIQFAATSFENEAANVYQYRLEGFDKEWSNWSSEIHKDYTNLPEGHYRFYVHSRDLHGHVSPPANFEFIILPPWYRTWWAYGAYGIIIFLILQTGVKIRFRYLEYRNRRLEEKVEARTREIQQQQSEISEKNQRLESANTEIEAQRDHLKMINEQLESAIKELKETQQQLIQSEKMASIGHMVAGIAHEINNPLTFITPNLEYVGTQVSKLLKLYETAQLQIHNQAFDKESIDEFVRAVKRIGSEVDVEEIKGSINATVTGSNRIKEIVANLRTFTGHHVEDIVETNIAAHLNQAIDLFFNQYQNIQFQKEFLSQRTVDVRVQEISQCFINILTNAVQAIRDAEKNRIIETGKGCIHIRTENATLQNEEAVKITINDNGIGIPSDVISKIFEPFFTTRSVGQGRGLGLSEVYAIVKSHQGHIDIRSEEKKGTSLEMILLCRYIGK